MGIIFFFFLKLTPEEDRRTTWTGNKYSHRSMAVLIPCYFLEILTETDRLSNQQTDMRVHREVTLSTSLLEKWKVEQARYREVKGNKLVIEG